MLGKPKAPKRGSREQDIQTRLPRYNRFQSVSGILVQGSLIMSVGLQGSCILILDPNRFDLTIKGCQRLFS
jgi:hypothetical protein